MKSIPTAGMGRKRRPETAKKQMRSKLATATLESNFERDRNHNHNHQASTLFEFTVRIC